MTTRGYAEAPRVGVGMIVLRDDEVLLVQRGREPSRGKWSIPGGLLELGETVEAAARREVEEECGIEVEPRGLVGVVDRILRDASGKIQYHYVLVDFWGTLRSGVPRAGSDAADVRWVPVAELGTLDATEGLEAMVEKALALQRDDSLSPRERGRG